MRVSAIMLISKALLVTVLLVLQVFAQESNKNDTIRRKVAFINLSKVQCQCIGEKFCKFLQCRLKAVRRNEAQLFLNISLFKQPVTNCKINIDAYRKYTGYKSVPFNVTVDACRYLENASKAPILYPIMYHVYQHLVNTSTFNHTCPYYESTLLVQNLTAKFSSFFSFVPSGNYMVKSRWMTDNTLRAIVTLWIEMYNPENTLFGQGF